MKIVALFQTEEQLIKACRQANPMAQRMLYERYAGKMLGVCHRYVPDEYEAEEVLIESFVKVFEKIEQFRLEGSFEGWIRRIVVNEALMFLRTKKRIGETLSFDDIYIEPLLATIPNDLEAADLLKVIENLPIGYRTVFNLYAIEGYSHQEIAAQLGIGESTSKSQLHRARAWLQQRVEIILKN